MRNCSKHHNQWEKTKSFPLKIKQEASVSAFSTFIHIVLEFLATVIRQGNEIKDIQNGKKEIKLSLFANDMIVYIENTIGATKN